MAAMSTLTYATADIQHFQHKYGQFMKDMDYINAFCNRYQEVEMDQCQNVLLLGMLVYNKTTKQKT